MNEPLRVFLEGQFNLPAYQRMLAELPVERFFNLSATPLLRAAPGRVKVLYTAFRTPLTGTKISLNQSIIELPRVSFYTLNSGGLDFAYLMTAPYACRILIRRNHCAIVPKNLADVGADAELVHQARKISILSDTRSVLFLLNTEERP